MRLLLAAVRHALAAAAYRRRVRRTIAALDGCDFCGEAGVVFLDVTPAARHVTARLACIPCKDEVVRTGGQVLMAADGSPIVYRN
jgi:hypothetical protein